MPDTQKGQMRPKQTDPELTGSFRLFGPSKEAVFINLEGFIILTLIPSAYFLLLSYFFDLSAPQTAVNTNDPLLMTGLIAGILLFLIVIPTVPYLQVKSAEGRRVSIGKAIRGGLRYFWRIHILNVLVALLVTVGFIFFIIPGVIFLRRYFLSPFYVINQDLSPVDAMKKSAEETKPYSQSVYGVIGVILLLSLIGTLSAVNQLISSVLSFLYSCAPAIRYLEIRRSY